MIETGGRAWSQDRLALDFRADTAIDAERISRHRPVRAETAEGALAALDRGDRAEHDHLVAQASRDLRDCDLIALAQYSMAPAAALVAEASGRPVVTNTGQRRGKAERNCLRFETKLQCRADLEFIEPTQTRPNLSRPSTSRTIQEKDVDARTSPGMTKNGSIKTATPARHHPSHRGALRWLTLFAALAARPRAARVIGKNQLRVIIGDAVTLVEISCQRTRPRQVPQ